MAASFGIVEEKLREAEFFLGRMRESSRLNPNARWFFSAFVSAARSVTLAMQFAMEGAPDFDDWYRAATIKLKADPLAKFFVEIRNESVHKGSNSLDRVTIEHLRDDLAGQMYEHRKSHVMVLPDPSLSRATMLVDALEACSAYFTSIVNLVYECNERFKYVVDPQWHFTSENFDGEGKGFERALAELGLPPEWAESAPAGNDRWRVLRFGQPACLINDVFERYLGRRIAGPDERQ